MTDDLAHRGDVELDAPAPAFELSDDVIGTLGTIPELLRVIVDELRNRQRPAVGIYHIRSVQPFVSHVGLRAREIVLTTTAAALVTVQVGSEPPFTFNLPGVETRSFPWPRNIPRGVDVVIATTAGVITGYIIADNE